MIAIALMSCRGSSDDIPPLDETYSRKDQQPFGAYVLHQQLQQFYYHHTLRVVKTNFASTWRGIEDTGAVYINISKNFFLTKTDLSSMLSFVYEGNSMFIASDRIDPALLDTLGCTLRRSQQYMPQMKATSVSLDRVFTDTTDYRYFYFPFYNHFTKWPKDFAVALGKNRAGTNFIVVFYGKGRFYLHAEPRALSNYFLLQKDNYRYATQVFSFTPAIPEHVYWDDYYNKKNRAPSENGERSRFAVLFQYPAMEWAFWLVLGLLLLYIFFGGKRRQRIVPILPPNINTAVAFTETISRLYLQQKDNRNIADKLITYLMEYIRNQYFLNTAQVNEEFIATLSRKANSNKESIEKLFTAIREIQQAAETTDQQLLTLNGLIENFYKIKK